MAGRGSARFAVRATNALLRGSAIQSVAHGIAKRAWYLPLMPRSDGRSVPVSGNGAESASSKGYVEWWATARASDSSARWRCN
mgnify:CR=1 FL=1